MSPGIKYRPLRIDVPALEPAPNRARTHRRDPLTLYRDRHIALRRVDTVDQCHMLDHDVVSHRRVGSKQQRGYGRPDPKDQSHFNPPSLPTTIHEAHDAG
jgi:hypothetical protein